MNRLLLINEDLVQQAASLTVQPALPVKAKQNSLPIQPKEVWKKTGTSLAKDFSFEEIDTRNAFLFQLLSYEQEKGHNALISIDELNVSIEISTRDLNKVTELDVEYSRVADAMYHELSSSI